MEPATPAAPPKEPARETPTTIALIAELSVALRLTASAVMPPLRSPLIKAWTSAAIMFSALAPDPLSPTPTLLPPAIAAEPAPTPASILAAVLAD